MRISVTTVLVNDHRRAAYVDVTQCSRRSNFINFLDVEHIIQRITRLMAVIQRKHLSHRTLFCLCSFNSSRNIGRRQYPATTHDRES